MGSLILIVEDDAIHRQYLAQLLRAAGHDCRLAGSLAAAQALLAEQRVDLCLIDCHLPDGDGRSLQTADGVPRLLMSGDLCADALLKPLSSEHLLEAVQAALQPAAGRNAGEPPAAAVAAATAATLDDELAARMLGSGNPALPGLRRLLAAELRRDWPAMAASLPGEDSTTTPQRATLLTQLHRYKASALLCGAAELHRACADLEAALRQAEGVAAASAALEAAVQRTLQQLQTAAVEGS